MSVLQKKLETAKASESLENHLCLTNVNPAAQTLNNSKSPSFYYIFLFLFSHSGWFLLSSSLHQNHSSLAQVLSERIHLRDTTSCLTLWYLIDSRSAKENYKPSPFSHHTVCDNAEKALYPVYPV